MVTLDIISASILIILHFSWVVKSILDTLLVACVALRVGTKAMLPGFLSRNVFSDLTKVQIGQD